jgi:outer membrane protein TolC
VRNVRNILLISLLVSPTLIYAQKKAAKIDVYDTQFEKELVEDLEKYKKAPRPKKENLENESKQITLRDALEMGLRKNAQQQIRNFTLAKMELDWDDNFYDFWFPRLSLTAQTGDHLVEKLYTDNDAGFGTTRTPNGYFGVEFSDYTLFNWGRDYLNYLNNKETYKRQKQMMSEQKRQLRFQIIDQYFNVVRMKQILRSRRDQLRHTSFIYRLAKEKLELKRIKSQEFLQTKEEFLRAQTEFHDIYAQTIDAEQNLAKLMGDDIGSSYKPVQLLKFKILTPTMEEAYEYANKQSPQFRDAKTNLNIANRSFKKTLKDNLPLPELSLKLGAYRHSFSQNGVRDTFGTSGVNNRNVEVTASVNMTWTLIGAGGFLNNRVQERSYIDKRIAEIEFIEAKREISVRVKSIYRTIRFLERQVEAADMRLKNSQLAFDKTLDNYIGGKTSFANMKLVIDALVTAETEYENSKYMHLNRKLELADLMGMEDFPGENFEKLILE